VYRGVVSRTNIDIDDEAVEAVMAAFRLRTKREAVNFALNRVRPPKPLTPDEILALEGIGWKGDLEAIKSGRQFEPDSYSPAS
jgi:Arc/MetJ family transcription regulator